MRTLRFTNPNAALIALALAVPAVASASTSTLPSSLPSASHDDSLVEVVNRVVRPTATQRPDVERIVGEHARQIASIRSDSTLSGRERNARVHEELRAMASDLKPILTPDQSRRLDNYLAPRSWFPHEYEVSASVESYLPSDGTARSIFGNAPTAFGVNVQVYQADWPQGAQFGWSVDLFSLVNNSNSIFVLSPQVSLEQHVPLANQLWAFGKLSAGPAYFDYSFDTPDGSHWGAKRIGADGDAEVGLRYGPVEVAAKYRLLTEAAGVNFSGLQLSLTWYLFHFRV
jgi:hypothetical protein